MDTSNYPHDKIRDYVARMLRECGDNERDIDKTRKESDNIPTENLSEYEETLLQAKYKNHGKQERQKPVVPLAPDRSTEGGTKKDAEETPYVSYIHMEHRSRVKNYPCVHKYL